MPMKQPIPIDIYGKADEEICAGCEHATATGHDCGPCGKTRTSILVDQFRILLGSSELGGLYEVAFYESTPRNIARNYDVQRLLSMASLEPVVCIGGAVSYLGGFSPEGLLDELRKKHRP